MTTNILTWLEESAKRTPDAIAFGDPNGEISYQDLVEKAKAFGTYLMPYVGIGEPCAFYMEKGVPGVIGLFGTIYAGGFYSFIDVRQPAARAAKSVGVLAPQIVITDGANAAKAEELKAEVAAAANVAVAEDAEQESFGAEKTSENEKKSDAPVFSQVNLVRIEDVLSHIEDGSLVADEEKLSKVRSEMTDTLPLYVNFTSGSTGTPKGVAVNHRSVIDFISSFTDIFGITKDDVIGNQAPFDFDVSVKDIYSGIRVGARVQIIPREYFSNPTMLMDYLDDHKASVLTWAVSAMCFVSIMNALDYKCPQSVRLVMFSGEVMPIKQLKVWKKYLPDTTYVNLYGPTEITCNCTYYILDKDHEYELNEVIPAGKAFPNEHVFLLDENDQLVPVTDTTTEGEICVTGTCVALGYYKDPQRTAAAFMQNPLNTRYDDRMYRTGDLGRYDEDGNIIYASRKDFQIKHMGHRIELGEIEADTMARDGVSRACCIYDTDKKRLVLFYTGERDKKELEKELRVVLPPFMIPNKTIQLEDMPLNKNGKIDRHALEAIYKAK